MEDWFLYLIKKSIFYSFPIVMTVAFLESLALVGLFLPGILFMAALGTLIGNGTLNFYPAWIAGFIGCICGDSISYYLGWKFKKYLNNFNLLKRNKKTLCKIQSTLNKYTVFTILIGKFVGPTRPLVPMVCGMLNISLKKFFSSSIFGCILWPPVYFFPGIIAGIAINTIKIKNNPYFKIFLIISAILIWLILWKIWKILKKNKY
ncbi:DedA family protein [Buchnera aphidicola]|uniref:DedA family protein n=1 Tax=Buchnera aphidicola TaxID=9 RepID=UPI00094DD903|nr:DedA family protein [Buchnera aphidicola]